MLLFSRQGVWGAALLALLATAAVPAARAQEPTDALIPPPPAALLPHHVPAAPPQGSKAMSPAADGTFYAAPADPLRQGLWTLPHSRVSALAAVALSGWAGVGPSPILNAGGGLRLVAQPSAGRIVAVAANPQNSSEIYVASAGGGVWKTTNGGASWAALTDNLPDTAMGALALDPQNPAVVYAGSGEANFSGDSRYGLGVYKSTDGGASWTVYTGPAGVFAGRAISKIVVDPTNSNTVFLTLCRAAGGSGGSYGVYKSVNGGATWTGVFVSGTPFTDLAIDPSSTQTVYAAAGEIFGSADNGIYKSTNGGATWPLLTGFPSGSTVGRIALALAPSSPQVLYADYSSSGTPFGSLGGFYATQDGGATWAKRPVSTDGTGATGVPNFLGGQGWYDNVLVVSPTNASEVFAAGVVNYNNQNYAHIVGLIGSFNGGTTWSDFSVGSNSSGPHTDHHALAFTGNGSALLNGNDGGLWRLENPNAVPTNPNNPPAGSIVWSNLNANLSITQFTGIALHPTDRTIAYGGSQDNGTEKYVSGGWQQVRGGDGGFTRVDQTNPQTVYHEYYGISLERSDDGGASWSGAGGGINPNDPVIDDGDDPAAFYVPYVLDALNQSRLVYGTNHVYESLDKANTFAAIGSPGVNGFNAPGNTISSIGTLGSTVYAGASNALYVTFNDGASWVSRATPNNGVISDIYINPNTSLDVYVTKPTFGGGHVFRSNDGGATFADISGNLPNEPFNAVKLDKKSGTLYAGGDDGVYLSTNYGVSWTKAAMPNVQVVDLAISPGAGTVGAGTHGRGMFIAPLSTSIAVPNLVVNAALTRPVTGGPLTITVTLKNIDNADETSVVISSVTLNSAPAAVAAPGTSAVGTVPARGQAPGVAYLAAASAASGTRAVVRVSGTSAQGSFSGTLKILVP